MANESVIYILVKGDFSLTSRNKLIGAL